MFKGFQKPKRLVANTETLTERYGMFTAQPFQRGFGTTIGIWDTITGEKYGELSGHWGAVRCVAFSPDRKTNFQGWTRSMRDYRAGWPGWARLTWC